MSAIDLMGGYAAYTTPDAAVAELATTRTPPPSRPSSSPPRCRC
ncbi:LxmA leader domain family RiPP [Streptomyces sp. MCAF7]